MFLDFSSHSAYLLNALSQKPSKIFISSFGLYAGITYTGQDTAEWGPKYKLATREMLEAMRKVPKVYLLIGVAPYKSCKEGRCPDCEKKYVQSLLRLVFHAEKFPEFKWRVSTELHLKCTLFFYPNQSPIGIAGGRNLSDSDWADLTFPIAKSDILTLFEHLMGLWNKSKKLDDATIAQIIKEQNIPDESLQAVVEQTKPF